MDVRTHIEVEAELEQLGERLAGACDGEEHRRLLSYIDANRALLGSLLLARDKKMRPEVYGLNVSHDTVEDRAVAKPHAISAFGKHVVDAVGRLADETTTKEALEAEIDVLSRRLARANDAREHDRIAGELEAKRKRLGALLLACDRRNRPSAYRH
jgi:hypothetical protein